MLVILEIEDSVRLLKSTGHDIPVFTRARSVRAMVAVDEKKSAAGGAVVERQARGEDIRCCLFEEGNAGQVWATKFGTSDCEISGKTAAGCAGADASAERVGGRWKRDWVSASATKTVCGDGPAVF